MCIHPCAILHPLMVPVNPRLPAPSFAARGRGAAAARRGGGQPPAVRATHGLRVLIASGGLRWCRVSASRPLPLSLSGVGCYMLLHDLALKNCTPPLYQLLLHRGIRRHHRARCLVAINHGRRRCERIPSRCGEMRGLHRTSCASTAYPRSAAQSAAVLKGHRRGRCGRSAGALVAS